MNKMLFSERISTNWRLAMLVGLLLYTLLVGYWMLFGFGRQVQPSYRFNLVPLRTIETYWHIVRSHTRASAINLVGNVAVFVPFGALIPLGLGGGWWRMLGIHTVCICILEAAQFVSKRGILDVDDLILNTLGAMMGYVLLALVSWSIPLGPVSQKASTRA